MNTAITFCHLKQHQLLLVKGPDAKKFLQGQVTCDVNALDETLNTPIASPLGAHCTHKGRMVFSFRAIQLPSDADTQEIALSIPIDVRDIANAALKKYSVFSKADITIDNKYQLFGVSGKGTHNILQTFLQSTNPVPTEANKGIHTPNGTVVCIATDCYELWLSVEQAQQFTVHMKNENVADGAYWDTIKMKSGIVDIHTDTSGVFTPHALNYHNIGNAVSFSKGCYTGQEVVARMQYLGQLKRQLYLFTTTEEIHPRLIAGGSLYTKEKAQSVGDIAMVSDYNEQTYLLASTIVEHAEKHTVFADADYLHPLQLVNN